MLDAQAMARTKPRMRLVDTARWPLFDQAELGAALRPGRCAGAARKVLTDRAAHLPIGTVGSGKDRDGYRRWLAVCWRDDGLELNAEMVRLGWALAYRPGNDPFPRPEYEPQEAEARAVDRGMWRGTFILPWEWRHR